MPWFNSFRTLMTAAIAGAAALAASSALALEVGGCHAGQRRHAAARPGPRAGERRERRIGICGYGHLRNLDPQAILHPRKKKKKGAGHTIWRP